MDGEFKWMVLSFVALFGLLFGGLFYGEHERHVEKMECMKLKGEYIKDQCVFRGN